MAFSRRYPAPFLSSADGLAIIKDPMTTIIEFSMLSWALNASMVDFTVEMFMDGLFAFSIVDTFLILGTIINQLSTYVC